MTAKILESSAPNLTCFFELNPLLDPKLGLRWVGLGLRVKKKGQIGLCWPQIGLSWPQIGFKSGFNPILYFINPNEPNFSPILGPVGPPVSKFWLGWVGLGPQGPNSG